jgi:hypothetical protein
MTGKRLLARTGLVAALGMLIFLVLSSVESQATPIKPDVQRLLKQSQQNNQPFIPARAGWNGHLASASKPNNPILESISDDHMRQEFRETLATVAIPDPSFVVGMLALIFLMRKLRSMDVRRKRAQQMVTLVPKPATPQARLAA